MTEAGPEPGPRRRASASSPSPRAGRAQSSAETAPPGSLEQRRLGLLEAAIEQMVEGVVVVDPEGHFVLVNESARRIVGMGPVDSPPADWSSLYGCFLPDKVTPYPSERLPLVRALRGEPVDEEDIFIRNAHTPDGAWISVSSTPLRDDAGVLAGGVVVFRDVTSHRRSREVFEQLSQAIENTSDAVFVTDMEGTIEYVNPAFEATTGFGRKEAIGRRPNILRSGCHPPAYYEQLWKRILAGEVHTGTLINRRKGGELFHAEQTITPVRDGAGNLRNFVSVMRDVTELKRGQEREIEIRLARTVQEKLYPVVPPALAGLDLAGTALFADQTCGDYFDFVSLADGRVAIVVGDVSGHGLAAALLMAETRAYLRSLVRSRTDLDGILGQLNTLLCEDTEDERFVTLLLAVLDPARRRLAFSSAGHVPGYVVDRSGQPRCTLEATGMPLGLFADGEFPPGAEVSLEDGDLIVLLTDGATEAENAEGDFFDAEGVLRVVEEERHRDAAGIVRELQSAIVAFTHGGLPRDDVTTVVCRVSPSP